MKYKPYCIDLEVGDRFKGIDRSDIWSVVELRSDGWLCVCIDGNNSGFRTGSCGIWEGDDNLFKKVEDKSNNFKSLYERLSS